jgi:hypothetical protein
MIQMFQFCFLLLITLASFTFAGCPNSCNGHGRCLDVSRCECFGSWTGGDCSQRKCPIGVAWHDIPSADDVAHAPGAICSNRGTCDDRTGECTCMQGFEGAACERMACSPECDAHGTCNSMRRHADLVDPGSETVGSQPKGSIPYKNNWDADMIYGCTCDTGYGSWNCATRTCPYGDDPMTTGQASEVQLLRCDLDPTSSLFPGKQFTFSFKNAVSSPFSASATSMELREALQSLPTVGEVEVVFTGDRTTWCDSRFATASGLDPNHQPASANVISIRFITNHGKQPRILVLDQNSKTLFGIKDNSVYTAAHGETLVRTVSVGPGPTQTETISSVAGETENLLCSGRGLCDTSTGDCVCFSGFTASDGRGSRGTVPNCGYAYLPVTSCPSSGGRECSGHGRCSGYPSYQCECFDGWRGDGPGDCSRRNCPFGAAWFDTPSDVDVAHGDAECSNKGSCDRKSGKCICEESFEGIACERMSCPGRTVRGSSCSGHGKCLSMSDMASYSTTSLGDPEPVSYGSDQNKASTWDARKVRGCLCDEDWTGYDCSLRSCPKGTDITALEADKTVLDEVQLLVCETRDVSLATSGSGSSIGKASFYLSFRGEVTRKLYFDSSASDVKAALEELKSIGTIQVEYSRTASNDPDTFCLPPPFTQRVYFSFISEHGDLPPIRVIMDDNTRDAVTLKFTNALGFLDQQIRFSGGDALYDFGIGTASPPAPGSLPARLFEFVPPYTSSGIRTIEVRKGKSDYAECANRGICDRYTGQCMCFLGFGASDRMRGKGYIEDCGWREEVVKVRGNVRGGLVKAIN